MDASTIRLYSRLVLCSLFPFFCDVNAAAAGFTFAELESCLAIEDDVERLSCLDRATLELAACIQAPTGPGSPNAKQLSADQSADAAVAAHAKPFPGLELSMNPVQAKSAGLDKLTAREIGYLNDWIQDYFAYESPVYPTPVLSDEIPNQEQVDLIRSQIIGEFTGWTGESTFYLKNGQVWRQRHRKKLLYEVHEPEVEIKKNFLGFYVLHLVGTPYSVGVTRIK